jgi:hypothetical protein
MRAVRFVVIVAAGWAGACLSNTSTTPVSDVTPPPVGAADDASSAPIVDAGRDVDPDVAPPPSDASTHPPTNCGPVDGGAHYVDPSTLPACMYDPTVDAGLAGCFAARQLVSCIVGGGCSFGPSEDGVVHPGGGAGVDPSGCADQCAPDEYGMECGAGSPPIGCKTKFGPIPGGYVFLCCPCK